MLYLMVHKSFSGFPRYIFTAGLLLLVTPIFLFSCLGDAQKRQKADDAVFQRAVDMYHSVDWLERKQGILELDKLSSHNKRSKNTDNKAIIFLIAAASEDLHSLIRIEAIKSLENYLHDKRSFECLKNISLNDKNNNVRWMAIDILSHKPTVEALDVFILTFSSSDYLIRETSVKGMLGIREEGTEKKILPYIIKALKDPAISVKIMTRDNLYFKDASLYTILAESMQKDKQSLSLLASTLRAIKGYKLDSKTKDIIILLLTHSDRDIRILALHALQNQKD